MVVTADGTRLEQVAANLIDNAVKYTPAGGRVDVEVARDGGRALLRVRDTGIGIPPTSCRASGIGCFAATPAAPSAASASA